MKESRHRRIKKQPPPPGPMNVWLPRASYPWGLTLLTPSCIKLVKSKGIDGPLLSQVRIHTENKDQASFCPFALARFSVHSLSSPWDICFTIDRCNRPKAKKTHPESVLGANRALQGGSALGARSVILRGRFPLTMKSKENDESSGISLTGQQRRPGHRKRRGLLEQPSLSSGRNPFQGHESYKEKITFPGAPSTSPSWLRYRLGPEGPISVSGWGILTPFLFGRREPNTRGLRSAGGFRFGKGFSDLGGGLTPVQAVHMENPFSSFSPQGST
ncbi:hypothetical protein JTE90_001991 [Oedothorax gibbosus]|uniref:Uncharacterized protein n=1 Tax=Oedothorax gibbosus TaxID=931172 RepID=A0AAV6TGE8_9ARAC|nr:hypothetical protein JTE90_001991 [Oedothorax gibbosus]